MPAATAVIIPVPPTIVATVVLPLVQVPPVVPSVKVIEEPAQTAASPPIEDGSGFTVMVSAVLHPVTSVYVIEVVPADTPVKVPDALTMVAAVVALLVHVPPVMPSVKEEVEPTHTTAEPDTADGKALTVTIVVV